MKTYEAHLKVFAIPLSIITVLIFNKYIYKLPTLLGMIAVVCLLMVFRKVIDYMPLPKKEMSKEMDYFLLSLSYIGIFLAFYLFEI